MKSFSNLKFFRIEPTAKDLLKFTTYNDRKSRMYVKTRVRGWGSGGFSDRDPSARFNPELARNKPWKDHMEFLRLKKPGKNKDDLSFCMQASESSLGKDWLRPEEDEAWKDF